MCGRFNLTATSETIAEHFQLQQPPRFQPSYNITPAQKILSIIELDDKSLKAVNLFWGLVPSWAKDSKNSHHLINARSETIRDKPSFRTAFHKRRCLIVAEGFYEWQQLESGKQAFNIHRQDNHLFAFAGLWEHWQQEQETLYSCTIITTSATDFMRPLHQRMPVIMPADHYSHWLDKTVDENEAFELLDNQAYTEMAATPSAIGSIIPGIMMSVVYASTESSPRCSAAIVYRCANEDVITPSNDLCCSMFLLKFSMDQPSSTSIFK